MLEGLNKIFSFVLLSPFVTIIYWWISQCSKALNLWILCDQDYIKRTPVPWHFGYLARTCVLDISFRTVSSTFHWEPSFSFVILELIVWTAIIVSRLERLWMVSGESYLCGSLNFFLLLYRSWLLYVLIVGTVVCYCTGLGTLVLRLDGKLAWGWGINY